MHIYRWYMAETNENLAKQVQQELQLPRFIADVLASQNFDTLHEVKTFLNPHALTLPSPFLFKDMHHAISRLMHAREAQQHVLVFGDKDVDGVTATALLTRFLQAHAWKVLFRVPEGSDGYGLSKATIDWAVSQNITTIITVDCGITATEEIAYAKQQGIDVILTDHHEPPTQLPDAFAIINPKVPGEVYPSKTLSGSGVAFKLLSALAERLFVPDYYAEEVVFVDIETTGLNLEKDDIIEIGAVRIKNGVVLDSFETLVLPETQQIREEITQLTGLTPEQVAREGIPIRDMLTQFQSFVKDSKLIGHNFIGFDGKVLDINYRKYLNTTLTNPVDDTLSLGHALLPELKAYRLSYIAESFGLFWDEDSLHRSKVDAELCAHIYRSMRLKQSLHYTKLLEQSLPLVALGTIADMMPLTGENRSLVRNGIYYLPSAPVGFLEICRKLDLQPEAITSKTISWSIAPVLNSPGRMGDASLSVQILLTNDTEEAQHLVKIILEKDNERKQTVQKFYTEVQSHIPTPSTSEQCVFFYSSRLLQRGLTGLLATRVCQETQLPSIIIAQSDSISSGSVRTVGSFHVVELLRSASDLLEQFGGHQSAGGFSIQTERIPAFHEHIMQYVRSHNPQEFVQNINVQSKLRNLDEINVTNIKHMLHLLNPIGQQNESPKFLFEDLQVKETHTIGKQQNHVLFQFQKGTTNLSFIAWSFAKQWEQMKHFTRFDVVGAPEINAYHNKEEIRMLLVDIEGKQ